MTTATGFGARLRRLSAVGRVAARVLPVDSNPVPAAWTHLTKIDPEPRRRLPLCYPRYLRHTDAVAVGGSTAVTGANTEATFSLLSVVDRPLLHEPSDPTHVTNRTRDVAAFVAVPQVLNGDTAAIVGELGAGIERVREQLAPSVVAAHVPSWTPASVRDVLADAATSWLLETAVFEAYLVQNPDSAAARKAGVTADDVLSPAEAARRAMVADRYLHSPVVYVEYSGTFGGRAAERVLGAVSAAVDGPRVWYGGGLSRRAETRAMLDAGADAVVVGNAFHEVAAEEIDLFDRAGEDLPLDASRRRVATWLSETVEVAETAAAAYLSTAPACSTPTATAEQLLVDTVVSWLRLRSVAASLPARPSRAALVDALSATDVVTGSVDDPPVQWARAALASVRGAESDPLGRHLSPAGVTTRGTEDGV